MGDGKQNNVPDIGDYNEVEVIEVLVKAGDEIVELDGQAIDGWRDLVIWVRERPGQEISIGALRNGKKVLLPVTTETWLRFRHMRNRTLSSFYPPTESGWVKRSSGTSTGSPGVGQPLWYRPMRPVKPSSFRFPFRI